MFNKDSKKEEEKVVVADSKKNSQVQVNYISQGTKVVGDLTTDKNMRIDGEFIGNIFVDGRLVIGNTGHIKGEVRCDNSEILGKVEGRIFVKDLLSLRSSATVEGEITTSKLSIDPGAIFSGSCEMKQNVEINSNFSSKNIKQEPKKDLETSVNAQQKANPIK